MNEKKQWTNSQYQQYLKELEALQEEQYRAFNQKLIKTSYPILGIRMPLLTSFVKQIKKTEQDSFLSFCGTSYYEEVLIEGFIIALEKNQASLEKKLEKYLPLIDNWAICDSVASRLKQIKKDPKSFLPFIHQLLQSDHEYTVRFGFVLLLNYYVEEEYLPLIFQWCEAYQQDKYYIQMAIAWLLSECYFLAKEATLTFLTKHTLEAFIYRKSLAKIGESRRISKEEKAALKTLSKISSDKKKEG